MAPVLMVALIAFALAPVEVVQSESLGRPISEVKDQPVDSPTTHAHAPSRPGQGEARGMSAEGAQEELGALNKIFHWAIGEAQKKCDGCARRKESQTLGNIARREF